MMSNPQKSSFGCFAEGSQGWVMTATSVNVRRKLRHERRYLFLQRDLRVLMQVANILLVPWCMGFVKRLVVAKLRRVMGSPVPIARCCGIRFHQDRIARVSSLGNERMGGVAEVKL